MNRYRILIALALLAAPLFAQAQATRPDLMYCGTPSRTGANLYLGVGPFNEVFSCTPTATTQAMLVRRGTSVAGQGTAWLDYLNNGGIIITEYSISDDVYNEIYGTAYPQPATRSGSCRDNAMPSLKFNPDGPFWQSVQIPETAQGEEACGFPLNAIVDGEANVTALGGWVSDGLVNFAERPQGEGVLYLLDADWQDSESFYTDDSRAFMGALIGAVVLNPETGTALFQVTKTFTNGDTGNVEVTLTCNGGLPLQQSFTISGDGPGVTFTVTNLPDTGADCEVTETGGSDGYTADLSACAWTGVVGGLRTCAIENIPEPTVLLIETDFDGTDDPSIPETFTTVLECTNVSPDTGSMFDTYTVSFVNIADASVDWYAKPGATSECTVELMPDASAVESDTCSFSFMLGDATAGCTVVGTVFFEGIPTLSQYGMAIMVLLMLGVGFVGMRRFV